MANSSDALRLLSIYRPYIDESAVSFEIEVPSQEEFAKRILNTLSKYPYLVAETLGELAGYAYAGPLRTRSAYQWSVEVSAYVSPCFHRKGVAKKLYQELFKILSLQGFAVAFAGITLPNEASVGFHQSLGFQKIGVYKNVGFKNGYWWDVGWYQKELQILAQPQTIKPFSELDHTELDLLLNKRSKLVE